MAHKLIAAPIVVTARDRGHEDIHALTKLDLEYLHGNWRVHTDQVLVFNALIEHDQLVYISSHQADYIAAFTEMLNQNPDAGLPDMGEHTDKYRSNTEYSSTALRYLLAMVPNDVPCIDPPDTDETLSQLVVFSAMNGTNEVEAIAWRAMPLAEAMTLGQCIYVRESTKCLVEAIRVNVQDWQDLNDQGTTLIGQDSVKLTLTIGKRRAEYAYPISPSTPDVFQKAWEMTTEGVCLGIATESVRRASNYCH